MLCSLTFGCAGSSFSTERSVRVTSVTGGGLVSDRISVSESICVECTETAMAFDVLNVKNNTEKRAAQQKILKTTLIRRATENM